MSTCVDCRFFQPLGGGGGHCRRNPPVVVVVTHPEHREDLVTDTEWPYVADTAWCGEFLGRTDAS